MIKHNDPAMPCNYVVSSEGTIYNSNDDKMGGLTIRQLFSKDAPDNIPYWFVSVHEDAPKFPEIPVDLEESKQKEIRGWLRDPIFDLPKDLMFFRT